MNKVRLFAVAAAMGMFVTTANAALVTGKPKDTSKTVTTVELSGGEEIVRAEFGGVVVAPQLTVNAFTETRTTKVPTGYETVGTTLPIYEGFTNKLAVDSNRDGMTDVGLLTWNSESKFAAKDENKFWYYDSAKSWPTVPTSNYYLGHTVDGIGTRVIAPGAAKNDGFVMVGNVNNADGSRLNYHNQYANSTAGVNTLIDVLLTAKKIETVTMNDEVIGYRSAPTYTYVKKEGKDTSVIEKAVYWQLTVEDAKNDSKTKLDDVKFAVVQLLSGQESYDNELTTGAVYYEDKYNITPDGDQIKEAKVQYFHTDEANAANEIKAGDVVVIDGNGAFVEVLNLVTTEGKPAKRDIYNDYRSSTRIVVIRQTARYGTEEVTSFKPATYRNAVPYNALWKADLEGFAPIYKATDRAVIEEKEVTFADVDEVNAWIKAGNGLYRVNTPANSTGKYLVDFNLGAYAFEFDYDYISQTAKTMTVNDDLVVSVEKIGSKWYPAFATAQEAFDFMHAMAKVGYANATRIASFKGTRTWADGTTTTGYAPQNALDAVKAQQITFATDKKAVEPTNVVVANNAATINTQEYGVHDLVYTASVDGKEVATKTVKVVIAPKYQRVYKNGKVVDLKAFHLNGNLYAHYAYDYTKKTVTTTFYNTDGVTVASTATSNLN